MKLNPPEVVPYPSRLSFATIKTLNGTCQRGGAPMLNIALEPREQEILAWALKSAVSDLGAEIADTENMEFRQDLKQRKAILLSIIGRLDR